MNTRSKLIAAVATVAIALAAGAFWLEPAPRTVQAEARPETRSKGHATGDVPEHHVAQPGAAPVTLQNLLANERFWPYQVALRTAPSGAQSALPAESLGVLIRVEQSGSARIDFGRFGIRDVPVEETDLVDLANQVRRGELHKTAANFVLAVGPRVADPASDPPRPYRFSEMARQRGFLLVFADPESLTFPALAAALGPLRDRNGVGTILFPQGKHSDGRVAGDLRAQSWPVPFVYDHLAEPYTKTLLEDGTPLPAVLLQSPEGRVYFSSAWTEDTPAELTAALDAAFGATESSRAARLPESDGSRTTW